MVQDVAKLGQTCDIHLLIELYERGDQRFFDEILRQFPSLAEEILDSRAAIDLFSHRLGEIRRIEWRGTAGVDRAVVLENRIQQLEKQVINQDRIKRPLTEEEATVSEAHKFQKKLLDAAMKWGRKKQ